jgi:hypothetical protein
MTSFLSSAIALFLDLQRWFGRSRQQDDDPVRDGTLHIDELWGDGSLSHLLEKGFAREGKRVKQYSYN